MIPSIFDSEQLQKINQIVKNELSIEGGCHDYDHTLRVLQNARWLSHQESCKEIELIEISALLHDISRPQEQLMKGKLCHAEMATQRIPQILNSIGLFDDKFIKKVCECVKRHRFRSKNPPITLPEKILYDADKLDSLGAIGIGRAFHFSGEIQSRVHNTKEEALNGEAYGIEDTAWREYLVKLRHIPELMKTGSGKKLATERVAYMDYFFTKLDQEINQNIIKG